jgi:hypothetical protein
LPGEAPRSEPAPLVQSPRHPSSSRTRG